MVKRRRGTPTDSSRLDGDPASGEDAVGTLTDEFDQERVFDGTEPSELPEAIAQLGVQARAEYLRVRAGLDLETRPRERLGTVGRYQLQQEIGHGGMGVVYRAGDPSLDRSVAIKLVAARPFAEPGKLQRRLLREAKTLARLTHPNVVRIYDFGRHGSEVYLAMEYVDGTTLRLWQEAKARSQREILATHVQAARGLVAAHAVGIVHRDYKPDNVLVASDGRVLVGDFGLAGVAASERGSTRESAGAGADATGDGTEHAVVTKTGAMLGTIPYMAPEQLRGRGATPRSDQFSFCVALWEALVGHRPFTSRGRDALAEEIERGQPRGAGRLPRGLRRLLVQGLAAEPEARHASLAQLADALEPREVSRWLGLGGLLVFSAGIATAVAVRSSHAGEEPCALEDSVSRVRQMPQWDELRARFFRGSEHELLLGSVTRLEHLVDDLAVRATELCAAPRSNDTDAKQQYLGLWVESLEESLEESKSLEPGHFLEVVFELEAARFEAPPPRALRPSVAQLLQSSRSRWRRNELEAALEVIDRVVKEAKTQELELELAVAQRYQGMYLSLNGEHEDAMKAFRAAELQAVAVGYEDAWLETVLLSAKTAIMRLGDMSLGGELLDEARALFKWQNEPWGSRRRADYHELRASLLKRKGEYDAAVSHQWLAVLMRGLSTDLFKMSTGYLNLGTAYEARLDGAQERMTDRDDVRAYYERAVEILEPARSNLGWYEAALNLGRWLRLQDSVEDLERAESLLREVSDNAPSLKIFALVELILLSLNSEALLDTSTRGWVQALRSELVSNPPQTPQKQIEAWSAVALGLAATGTRDGIASAVEMVRHSERDRKRDLGAEARLEQLERTTTVLDSLLGSSPRSAADPSLEPGADVDTRLAALEASVGSLLESDGLEAALDEIDRDAAKRYLGSPVTHVVKNVKLLLEQADARRASTPVPDPSRPVGADSDTNDRQ